MFQKPVSSVVILIPGQLLNITIILIVVDTVHLLTNSTIKLYRFGFGRSGSYLLHRLVAVALHNTSR